jgi:hypothetical protein
MQEEFPAIDRVLSRFKNKHLNNRTDDCCSNLSKECESEDCGPIDVQSDDSLERSDSNRKSVESSLLGFLDRHSNDPLFIRVDYRHLRNLVGQRLLNTHVLTRRNVQEMSCVGTGSLLDVRLKHLSLWSYWTKHRIDIKRHFLTVEKDLWDQRRFFLSKRAQLRCIERFGKFKLAELYCKWRILRRLLSAFLRNYFM